MLVKYLKSKKGSTLVLVLVTLSILSILGTAIIGLSVINYKMKIIDKNVKTSFYLAEAGLEEAYAVIGKSVEDAIKAGNKKVEATIDVFIADERRKEAFDPEFDESDYINGSDGFGTVNERMLEQKIEEWFREGYAKCINDGYSDEEYSFRSLETRIKDTAYGVVESSIDGNSSSISVIEDPVKFPDDINELDEDDEYQITLESEFPHKNITKIVRGTFDIKIPTHNSPYYVKNVMVNMDENVLWTKPITTDENIYVLGDDVEINGDVYAYGDDENGIEGGIIVGNDGEKGKLKVKGNISTDRYVYTNEDGSNISVAGDIYCNTIAIPEETIGCYIEVVDGAVNTYDDIELNGKEATIKIDGPYYGFKDGSSYTTTHDQSSSIVINSDDIGHVDGSKLIITGEESNNNNFLNSNIGKDGEDDRYPRSGVFIGGTVYISLDNSVKYQTGESVSIQGNYKAYSEYLKEGASRDEKFKPENIELGSFPPLVLVSKLNGIEPDVKDKSEYINFYDSDYGSSPIKKLNLGGENGIKIDNIQYSAGAFIQYNTIKNRIAQEGLDTWIRYSRAKLADFGYFVNKMSDYFNFKNPYNMSNPEERISIDDRFSFDINIGPSIENNEILCVNRDSDKAIFIKGENGTSVRGLPYYIRPSSYESINLSDADVNGIIVSKGDVFITGEINYTGIIVAEGNVFFYDDKTKKINNRYNNFEHKSYILNAMYKNESIRNMFKNGKEKTMLVEVEAGESEVESYLKFENLVDIKWEKVK